MPMMSHSQSGHMPDMMSMMKTFFDGMTAHQSAMLKSQLEMTGPKRKRAEEEEEEAVDSSPILIDVKNHHLRDDATTIIDWKARDLHPYNGGDQDLYWSRRPKKAVPVIQDLRMSHLTKVPINPKVCIKVHDRGAETTAKQWLSSNYGVEEKDRKLRAERDGMAGAFLLDYNEPKGVWEAVDAIHNYAAVLRQVRPDDWTGELLLRTLHDFRMFAHPSFDAKAQRSLIMDLFDQVLRHNAMMGKCKKPPMDRKEMKELATELLFRIGKLVLSSFYKLSSHCRRCGRIVLIHCTGALLQGREGQPGQCHSRQLLQSERQRPWYGQEPIVGQCGHYQGRSQGHTHSTWTVVGGGEGQALLP